MLQSHDSDINSGPYVSSDGQELVNKGASINESKEVHPESVAPTVSNEDKTGSEKESFVLIDVGISPKEPVNKVPEPDIAESGAPNKADIKVDEKGQNVSGAAMKNVEADGEKMRNESPSDIPEDTAHPAEDDSVGVSRPSDLILERECSLEERLRLLVLLFQSFQITLGEFRSQH